MLKSYNNESCSNAQRNNEVGNMNELSNEKYNALKLSRKHIFAIENINQLPPSGTSRSADNQENGNNTLEDRRTSVNNMLEDGEEV
jgi:hypothetical protein